MNWKKQGSAVVGSVLVTDGRKATVVLVSARSNPKGAALVLPANDDRAAVATEPVANCLHLLTPKSVIDILTMQERVFGQSGLPAPSVQDA